MIEEIPHETKLAGLGGLVILGLAVLRFFGMRASKDLITLKSDQSDRAAIDSMQTRVDLMDERIDELENERLRLVGLIARQMAYITQCQCDVQGLSKAELLADYAQMIDDLSKHGKKER